MGSSVDRRAFDTMNYAAADKTAVNLTGDKAEVTSEDVHNMLMAAGFAPGFGNIADAADAILYAAEGEFGAAGLSMAAIIPFIGQTVSAKRALKIAKESGEEMISLYRGVDKWHPGEMVKKGKFVSPSDASNAKLITEGYGVEYSTWATRFKKNAEFYSGVKRGNKEGIVLEFEVPKSWYHKQQDLLGTPNFGGKMSREEDIHIFLGGLPKEFLKKVHK